MRKSEKIASIPALLKQVQSLLWYNDTYKLFFSDTHTNNPQEYYWFMLDIKTGKRTHGRYRLTTDALLVQFLHSTYKVKDLASMRTWDIIMIQTINIENELDYMNWLGISIPIEKGAPYIIKT